ncbi:hypothetical protein JW906_05395 [bacterium]|nr:hypothetical protein [bacterium]
MKRIILMFLALASGASGGDANILRLSLRGNRTVWCHPDSVRIHVWMKNVSADPISIVLPQDGSGQKFRYPHAFVIVLDSAGEILKDSRPCCKTVDPLTSDGFRRILPGESVPLFPDGFAIGPFLKGLAGDFSLVFVYSTQASREAEWFGLYTDEYWKNRNRNSFWKSRKKEIAKVQKLLQKVPRITLVSDTLHIRVGKASGITREMAMEIARSVCAEQGWEWEGVHAEELTAEWRITTGFGRLGCNAFIRIEKTSGRVLDSHLTGP